jgi:hypothetical protein
MIGMDEKDNVVYPISGGSVAITLSFPTVASDTVKLTFVGEAFVHKYVVEVDLSTPVTFKLLTPSSRSVTVPHNLAANEKLQFWVDFSSVVFVVGMGTSALISLSHSIQTVSRMTITPGITTTVTASVCSKRGKTS